MISIRVRLSLWYTATLLCALVALAVFTSYTLSQLLLADIDASLSKWAKGAETVLTNEAASQPLEKVHDEIEEYSSSLPEGSVLQVQDARNHSFFQTDRPIALPAVSGDTDTAIFSTARMNDGEYRTLTTRITMAGKLYRLQLAASLEPVNALHRRFRAGLFWIAPVVLAIASLGGFWISSRALAPVDAMTYAARAISLENLSERLKVPRTHDELARLSQTWNDMLDRLEAAVKRLSQFTADASHELRSPTTLIRTTTEIALSQPRSAEQYQVALEQVMATSLRMSKLIEDLLELARADMGRTYLPVAEVDLCAVARRAHAEMFGLAAAREHMFSLQVPDTPISIMGNEAALHRLLIILLDNAIKFTPPGGRIELLVEQKDSVAIVRVTDNGIGMPEGALPHIFERFFRSDGPRTPAEGAGLGLSIAQTIVRAHSAAIDVSSSPGKGSVFQVAFTRI